jgi:hypothetical protein
MGFGTAAPQWQQDQCQHEDNKSIAHERVRSPSPMRLFDLFVEAALHLGKQNCAARQAGP